MEPIWTSFTYEIHLQGGCVSYQELLRSGRGGTSQPGNGCHRTNAKQTGDFNRGLQGRGTYLDLPMEDSGRGLVSFYCAVNN